MKSIGIFGDSFTGITNSPGFKYHWATLLSQYYDFDLQNYGLPGSSVYYTFREFKKNYSFHDINIVLISEPGRYVGEVNRKSDGQSLFVPNLNCLIDWRDDIFHPDPKHLEGWFLCSDDQYNTDMTDLMVQGMQQLDPKAIFIPCFPNSISQELRQTLKLSKDDSLYSLQEFQANYFSTHIHNIVGEYAENHEFLSGHFIPELNEFIFQSILKKISTGIWDWKIPEGFTSKYHFTDLWRKL